MKGGLVAARDAARAAEDSNTKLERPWVFVFVDKDNVQELLRKEPREFPLALEVTCTVVNYGRSPAWMVGGSIDFFPIKASEEEAERPPYRTPEEFPRMPLPTDGERPHGVVLRYKLTAEDFQNLLLQYAGLFVYGTVLYEDVYGRPHMSRFAWAWTARRPGPMQGWVRFGVAGPSRWTEYT